MNFQKSPEENISNFRLREFYRSKLTFPYSDNRYVIYLLRVFFTFQSQYWLFISPLTSSRKLIPINALINQLYYLSYTSQQDTIFTYTSEANLYFFQFTNSQNFDENVILRKRVCKWSRIKYSRKPQSQFVFFAILLVPGKNSQFSLVLYTLKFIIFVSLGKLSNRTNKENIFP